MKNKGFTLIELLGVITILSIIALIAGPAVTNLIANNKQKVYNSQIDIMKDSLAAYASDNVFNIPDNVTIYMTLYQLAEKGYVDLAINNPITNQNFPIDMVLSITNDNGFSYNVDVDSGSYVYTNDEIETLGILSLKEDFVDSLGSNDPTTYIDKAVSNGSDLSSSVTIAKNSEGYYIYTMTDSNNKKVSSFLNVSEQSMQLEIGDAVYFNPVTGLICNDYVETNSNTGVKTGCMKWYAYSVDEQTVNLILDHNTTAVTGWNYSPFSATGPTNESGYILYDLYNDTSTWSETLSRTDSYSLTQSGARSYTIDYTGYKARLISAEEIAAITNNTSFNVASTLSTGFFYFETNSTSEPNPITTKYGWLFDRTSTCIENGCLNNADAATTGYGYFTSSSVAGGTAYAWRISRLGNISYAAVNNNALFGVRPVITISKDLLN